MKPRTAELWARHDHHQGDRWRLFRAVAEAIDARSVFYPGSYVDIAPSFVFGSVTYLDTDKRTPSFFGDTSGIREIIADHNGPADADLAFIHADYTGELELPHDYFDLLVSLYAGFIYELTGVVISRDGNYKVGTSALNSYLVPKKPQPVTMDSLHASGKAIAYTKSPFAYLFTRVR